MIESHESHAVNYFHLTQCYLALYSAISNRIFVYILFNFESTIEFCNISIQMKVERCLYCHLISLCYYLQLDKMSKSAKIMRQTYQLIKHGGILVLRLT